MTGNTHKPAVDKAMVRWKRLSGGKSQLLMKSKKAPIEIQSGLEGWQIFFGMPVMVKRSPTEPA
jgi:hypothetical protein